MTAFNQAAALKAGIELDVFTAIGEGATEPASLAKRVGGAERGVRILCDSLTVLGFLHKRDGHYALAPDAALFLDRRSPACLSSMSQFLTNDRIVKSFAQLTDAVKRGGTATDEGDNEKPHDSFWVNFARSMAPMSVLPASAMAEMTGMREGRACRVLDIAAGHGMYGITMARMNPQATVTAVDWPAVLEVAKENAWAAGVSERYEARAGSAFETELGDGYDFVLLTNIFHHFDQPTCERLMKRVHRALKPGGSAVTLEFVPDEGRVSPPQAAMFSLMMLATTDKGDAYTLAEYEQMFGHAGFARTSMHPVPGLPQRVLLSEKAA